MCDKRFEKGIKERILGDIYLEFSDAAKAGDVETMNRLHDEWLLFDNCEENRLELVYAKVSNGKIVLPDKIKKLIKNDVVYKYVLRDTKNIYLVDSQSAVYNEGLIYESKGKSIYEKEIYVKETIAIDDKSQKVFEWNIEDIAIIHIVYDVFRIDKFELNDNKRYTII